jgi:hypothetical protein
MRRSYGSNLHRPMEGVDFSNISQERAPVCPILQSSAYMRHAGLARQGLGSLRCPLPPPLVSSCSGNLLGAEGATALSSGLTALTNLRSIRIR